MQNQNAAHPVSHSQGVEKLCNELSARRKGDVPASTTASSSSKGVTDDDFWGGGVAGGGLGGTAGAAGGRQAGKSPPIAEGGNNNNNNNRGKGRGKVYQKSAVEEDFWGGGTTSGRAKSASAPSAAAPGGRKNGTGKRGPARAAAAVVAAPAPAPAAPAAAAANARKGGGATGTSTKGDVGGGRVSSKQPLASSPPAAAAATAASKPSGGGGRGAKTTAVPATPPAPAPVPEWSGVTCLCMGKTHDVVTNCTNCGKIACVKEGGYGCSFCGCRLPTTGREPRSVTSGGVDGAVGAAVPQSAALKEALERKDRLLLFDRTSASRTRVLDDQGVRGRLRQQFRHLIDHPMGVATHRVVYYAADDAVSSMSLCSK